MYSYLYLVGKDSFFLSLKNGLTGRVSIREKNKGLEDQPMHVIFLSQKIFLATIKQLRERKSPHKKKKLQRQYVTEVYGRLVKADYQSCGV